MRKIFVFFCFIFAAVFLYNKRAVSTYQPGDPDDVKQVALTFDDGPNPYYTMELLDGLKERDVKATFFILGEEAEKYPDIVKAINSGGHQIGIHSYKHADFTAIGYLAALDQIEQTQDIIYSITGEYAGFVRPPYGSWQKDFDEKLPLIAVLWDVDPMDWATNDADTVVSRVESNVKDGSIILMHDASASTVQAALRVIDLLTAQDYEFVTVEELMVE